MNVQFLFAALLAAFIAGCASAPREAREALAAGGKLRVGVNLANPVLAKRDAASGEVSGITMDLGRLLAKRLDAEFVPVFYPNPGALIEGARAGAWDIGFAAVDPARADVLAFTAAYMEVSITYLVPADSPIRGVADADRPGVRIGVGARNAADLFLSRSLKQAELVRAPDNLEAALELLQSGKANIYASNRDGLMRMRDKLGAYRLLDERFYAVEHAVALPRSREASLSYVKAFVEELKASGEIAGAIGRHSLRGVDVAPPAR